MASRRYLAIAGYLGPGPIGTDHAEQYVVEPLASYETQILLVNQTRRLINFLRGTLCSWAPRPSTSDRSRCAQVTSDNADEPKNSVRIANDNWSTRESLIVDRVQRQFGMQCRNDPSFDVWQRKPGRLGRSEAKRETQKVRLLGKDDASRCSNIWGVGNLYLCDQDCNVCPVLVQHCYLNRLPLALLPEVHLPLCT